MTTSPYAWGTAQWKAERDVYLKEWIANDEAFEFLMLLSDATELWDDIIDMDKPLVPEQVHKVFTSLLVQLPNNAFFLKHMSFLTPLLITSINSWMDSDVLRDGTKSERSVAYVIRNLDIQIVQAIIYITRGHTFLRTVSPSLWRMFAAEQDDVTDWVEGDGA